MNAIVNSIDKLDINLSLYLGNPLSDLSPRVLQESQGVFVGSLATAGHHRILASWCQRHTEFLRSVPVPEGHHTRKSVSFPF